jgi:hypothetical protein
MWRGGSTRTRCPPGIDLDDIAELNGARRRHEIPMILVDANLALYADDSTSSWHAAA